MKITLCIDKQNRGSPSEELKEYIIDIGCPLRSVDDVFDELKISTDDNNILVGQITRRCYVDKYGVLKKLEQEEIQELDVPDIELFEGTNYVYIKEFTNLNMKLEYLTNAEMNKYFATKMEMNSSIKQTADSISLEVAKKVDENEIISKINLSPEEIKIKSNKLSLEGYTTINNSFSVDENGDVSITEGTIYLKDNSPSPYFFNLSINNDDGDSFVAKPNYLRLMANEPYDYVFSIDLDNSLGQSDITLIHVDSRTQNEDGSTEIKTHGVNMAVGEQGSTFSLSSKSPNEAFFMSSVVETYVKNLRYDNISQSSLASLKKNIKKIDNRCLDVIKNANIYEFNYNTEEDDTKKHIGFVIGRGYKTPEEIINNSRDGIDFGAVSSLLWKSVQEQQEIIEKLEYRVDELEKKVNANE